MFDGDTATFEYPKYRPLGEKPYVDRYKFVLNSAIDPKMIRCIHRLGEGEPIPGHQQRSNWYELGGDALPFWDQFLKLGEAPKYHYRRVGGGQS